MPAWRDLVGQQFGHWSVEAYLGASTWRCRCVCGAVRERKTCDLRGGATRSCGCISGLFVVTHGATGTPEHRAWKHLRGRCNNPRDKSYHNYGGRGIKVCARWDKFENFLADIGLRPSSKHSVERDKVDGDYEPANCRWATAKEQARNTRKTVFIGNEKLVDMADRLGVKASTLHARRRRAR